MRPVDVMRLLTPSGAPPPGPGPAVLSIGQTDIPAAATAHNVNMPGTVNAGDLLLVSIVLDGADAVTTPSGWTFLIDSNDSGGGGTRTWVYYKYAAGTEGGTTVNFVSSGSRTANAVTFRIGSAATAPQAVQNVYASSSAAPTPLTPSWGALDTLWIVVASGYFPNTPSAFPLPNNNLTYLTIAAYGQLYVSTKNENIATQAPGNITFGSIQYGSLITIGVRP